MDKAIEISEITGGSVYGVTQVEYTVDGNSGLNFVDAVTTASFKVATAIEEATSAYSAVVKARQKKVDELGDVLACFTESLARLDHDAKTYDEADVKNYSFVKDVLERYEIEIEGFGSRMTNGNLQKAQTEVEYQIDREDNQLQQDLVTVQSYISKRDNAYSNASKIVKKANNAASSTIRNIGG